MADAIESFLATRGRNPSVLILGSIPGVASLQAQQYYAHPRNAFWPIMASYFKFDASLPYDQRCQRLSHAGVVLWDVLNRCRRQGSLDSAIETDSIEVNPIADWLRNHATVRGVLLNGGTAAKTFRQHFQACYDWPELQILTMPSTSPAYAAMKLDEKKAIWHRALTDTMR